MHTNFVIPGQLLDNETDGDAEARLLLLRTRN